MVKAWCQYSGIIYIWLYSLAQLKDMVAKAWSLNCMLCRSLSDAAEDGKHFTGPPFLQTCMLDGRCCAYISFANDNVNFSRKVAWFREIRASLAHMNAIPASPKSKWILASQGWTDVSWLDTLYRTRWRTGKRIFDCRRVWKWLWPFAQRALWSAQSIALVCLRNAGRAIIVLVQPIPRETDNAPWQFFGILKINF